jgi:hypothetical protein
MVMIIFFKEEKIPTMTGKDTVIQRRPKEF